MDMSTIVYPAELFAAAAIDNDRRHERRLVFYRPKRFNL
jgi:hypothetical protein